MYILTERNERTVVRYLCERAQESASIRVITAALTLIPEVYQTSTTVVAADKILNRLYERVQELVPTLTSIDECYRYIELLPSSCEMLKIILRQRARELGPLAVKTA